MGPELSILIPVRDEEENVKIISDKIEKEIANPNYELLFVNDFSEDDTVKVIEEIKDQNKKIRYVNNDNKGLGGAISLGITESKGKYLCIMMSDSSDTVEDLNRYYETIMTNDLVKCFWYYYINPKLKGEVYNIGGGRYSNCSVEEALRQVEKIKNIHIKRKYIDKSRTGDHKWWISDIRKFKKDYPEYRLTYNTRKIITELIDFYSKN